MTTAAALVGAASNGKALWYLTRSTGLVALVLLTATVVLGVVASVGWTTERWPRFLSQNVHRNLSLFCVGFVAIHVITTVSDGYVPIGFADAFIPFRTPYRPVYVGLGALTFDLLLAVLVTSALRHRIGFASWRFVHWLAYLCFPIALFHSLGSGTDAPLPLVLMLDAVCAGTVGVAVCWRLVTGRTFSAGRRTAAAVGTVVVGLAVLVFAALGPLRPGWSHRAGTSTALLAQLAQRNATAGAATGGTAGMVPATSTTGAAAGPAPSPPFTVGVTGTQSTSGANNVGQVQVVLSMHLQNAGSTPLTVTLVGEAVQGGGVAMSSGTVTLGSSHGVVTSLDGGTVSARLSSPTPMDLSLSLQVDQNSGALSGTATGTARSGGGDSH
jgi:DMSO/TMAO reductase YedYZ heme-binding membrane subunit